MDYQIQKVLKVGETFPVNEELAGIVPMAAPNEQAILTEDIIKNGLITPITLYKGKVVDGRCRQLACIAANVPIRAVDLDDSLTEDDVRAYVKAVNTRRNLTHTQKTMIAARESFKSNTSLYQEAKAWGISLALVKNGKWLWKNKPDVAQKLFDGKSFKLPNGKTSNKVSTIYAYYKAELEEVSDNEHGWKEDTFIKTQKGKNWYYSQLASLNNINDNIELKMLLAELANYKYPD